MRWLRRKRKPPARHPLPGWPAAARSDSLADDLRRHIYESYGAVPAALRQHGYVRWVMTAEWHNECRKLSDPGGYPLSLPSAGVADYLLGLPVEVRAGSGPPHLEPLP